MSIFISNYAIAQYKANPQPIKDLAEIKQMPASADKTMHLLRYARNPRIIHSDELKILLEEALKNAKDIKRDDLTAGLISTKAIIELELGNSPQAINYISEAEEYLPKLGEAQTVTLLSDLTRIYRRTGDIEKTNFYYDKIEAFTKDKAQFIIPRVSNLRNRTNLEMLSGNIEKVRSNYELAIKLSKESDNPSLLKDTRFAYANVLLNMHKEEEAFTILKELIPDLENMIGNRTVQFFDLLSRNYQRTGDYKNAFIYAEKEFNLTDITKQQKGNTINRMILLSFLLKDYSKFDTYFAEHKKYGMDQNSLYSRKQYQLAESRYYEVKEKNKLAKTSYLKTLHLKLGKQVSPNLDIEALTGLANIYLKEGKNDSASFYIKKADQLLKQYPTPPATRLIYTNAIKNLNQYRSIGTDTLIKNLEQEIQLKDTIYQINLAKATRELETKYRVNEKEKALELAKKQQQLHLLEIKQQKQQSWFIIISATIAILLFLTFIYVLLQRRKQAALLHDATLDALKKQHRLAIMNTLTDTQEQEKKRVAERLHDEVGAMLSIAKLNINTMQDDIYVSGDDFANKLLVTQNLMNDISETIRNISHDLMPIALEKYGFKAAILDLITTIKAANSLNVEYIIKGFDHTEDWPQRFTLSTYRIIQEIINNTIKHAEATHLFVQLIELENAITIYIEDNGKGLDSAHTDKNGVGMTLLTTNIAYLSGKLEMKGEPNEGTFTLVEIPVPNAVTI